MVLLEANPNFVGLGFKLIGDEQAGTFEIGSVLPNSPASQAGLKENDLILKINNQSLSGQGFTQIFNMFNQACVSTDEYARTLQLELIEKSLYLPDVNANRDQTNFKRCDLKYSPDFGGFGLTLAGLDSKPKHSVIMVEPNSPAHRANLRKYDVIIEINQKNVRRSSYAKVIKYLEEAAATEQVSILAISRNGYNAYKKRNKRFSNRDLVTEENTDNFVSSALKSKMI